MVYASTSFLKEDEMSRQWSVVCFVFGAFFVAVPAFVWPSDTPQCCVAAVEDFTGPVTGSCNNVGTKKDPRCKDNPINRCSLSVGTGGWTDATCQPSTVTGSKCKLVNATSPEHRWVGTCGSFTRPEPADCPCNQRWAGATGNHIQHKKCTTSSTKCP